MGHRYGAVSGGRRMAALLLAGAAIVASGVAASAAGAAPKLVWRIDEPARGVPARDRSSIYFLTRSDELAAVRLSDGHLRWRIPLDVPSPTFASRVIVRGDVVVAGAYDLLGIDKSTGRVRWIFAPEDGGGAGMHLGDARADLVFTGSVSGYLRAIDVRTGRLRWQHQLGLEDDTTVYSPVVSGPWVAATYTVFGGNPVGGLAVADARTGALLWHRQVPGSVAGSGLPAFAGRVVLAASRDGTIHGFDVGSGEALWSLPAVSSLGGDPDYRPVVVSGPLVVVGSLSGEISAWELSTRRLRWRRPSELYSVLFRMTVAGNVVYAPLGSGEVVALRLRDGRELWRIGGVHDRLDWLPLVDGRLLAAAGMRSLAVFQLDAFTGRGAGR